MRGEFLDLHGARLYYYAAGTRGAGDPILFLHGFPTSSHLWTQVVPLAPSGHRLVVLDLLGYGRSDRPLGRDLSIRGHASRLAEVLDQLRIERACLVGHGLGGGIAQAFALEHPRRTSRLCLVNPRTVGTNPPWEVRLAHSAAPLLRRLPPGALAAFVRRAMLRGYAAPSGARSLDHYLRPFAAPEGRDALLEHIAALVDREPGPLADPPRQIEAPTAIVWGGRDPFLPASVGTRLAAAVPGATLEVVEDAGHFTPEEAPHRVAAALASLLRAS